MALLVRAEIHGVDDISEEPLGEEEMTQGILEGMTEEIADVMIDVTREETKDEMIDETSDEMIGEMIDEMTVADGLVQQEDEKKITLDREGGMRMIEINEDEMNQDQERVTRDRGPDQGHL